MKKKKITSSVLVCILILLCCFIGRNNVFADEMVSNVDCIKNMVNKIMKNNPDINKMDKTKQKQALINSYYPYFDLEWMAKMSIGINYKGLDDVNQGKYLKEFAKFFSYIWLPYLYVDNTLGARVVVKDKITKINNDEYIDVVIYSPDGKTFNLKLRVRNKPEWQHCKILNIVVDGVDLAMSYRAQFDAYIEKNNGKSSSVIEYLAEKNIQYKKTSGIVLPID